MANPDLANINNFFAQAKNQFTEPIYNWVWRSNPYVSLFPRAEYDYMDGLVPEVVTTTSELPTSYPDNLATLTTLSDGTGSTCDMTPTVINDGIIHRSYSLELDAWESRVLCLTDLQFDWKAAQTAANLQRNIQQFATVRWSDWYRIKNICMSDNKITCGSGVILDSDQNSNCNFSGLTLPTASTGKLSWPILNDIYDQLVRNGGGEQAVGMSEGMPLFALSVGPGYKRQLFQYDSLTRDTVNWGDAFQNFTARGINTSINGFIPNVDDFPIRYKADGTTKIYPTINVAATKGRKFIANPDYLTMANGGLAVYEVAYVLPRNVYEVRVRPTGPTQFAQAAFNPINYVGEIRWINNPDMGSNVLGNKGFYRIDLAMAAKPVRPELGYAILCLAQD